MNVFQLQEYDKTKICWELENIPFLHSSRNVIIKRSRQGENESKLIKYLLKHAKNLQKMTVSYDSLLPLGYSREVAGYEKASF
ncbi:FBD domain containing protein [Trema orientale]|uniref:FBD domain containing protein n=1 Tax=Trema orientale TaxID=63057 RepID=A0A2P5E675_TREOI|nr:FBD domain containing protein [Trema orientale]